ncbi:unnamed protein product [Cylicocyclus nassatus]|uniref:Uncharacterized protein n=1 Tax=Cylicocyclus nassatus TaxID=53992 RepID=A0AA36H6P6_CYLNA|nr:unnamed protein product [Cylicocyclus nassatus]
MYPLCKRTDMELEVRNRVLNEDVALVIIERLADKCFVNDPRVHWTNLAALNRVFNRAVHRLLSRTYKIALADEYGDVRVIIFCDAGSDKFHTSTTRGSSVHPLISSISFKKKEQAAAFVRFLTSNVRRSVILDLEDYCFHSDDDPAVGALSHFSKIDTITFRDQQCRCPVCSVLTDHSSGPRVEIFPSEVEPITDNESSNGYEFHFEQSDEDDYDDLYFSDLRDVDDY